MKEIEAKFLEINYNSLVKKIKENGGKLVHPLVLLLLREKFPIFRKKFPFYKKSFIKN